MPRSFDLDTIAPDDMIEVDSVKSEQKIIISKNIPTTSTTIDTPSDIDSVYKILGHAKSSLSSLLIHPHVFNFSEQDDDEVVLVVARQHWFTNVRWILTTFILLSLPSLVFYVPRIIELPIRYQFIAYLFWYLITFAYSFENFISWYFNVYIITNKRIIDIDFNNLLTKRYSEAGIEQVQDVTSSVIGAIPTMFNYGTILVQTASEINELEFSRVPNPEKIIKVLQELRDHHPGGKI